ncbi:MAG: hypothetical protein JWQ77_475 [Jatrophihabitans sp.]|nr:hypothetical protein [Jatrophihabitans sp.]
MPGRDPSADIAAARRGVATFDAGDEPGVGDAVRGFTRRYGWRAYALPILVIITIVALMTVKDPSAGERGTSAAPTTAQPSSTGASNPPAASDTTVHSESASPNSVPLNALSLPPGAPYTKSGEGTYSIVKGTTKPFGHSSTGKIWTYDIEVEKGVTGIDVAQFAALVDQTLADPRSWSGHGVELQRVDSGTPDFRVSMTSAFTVRKYCGYTIKIETSCYAAAGSVSGLAVNRVVFDDARWVRGAPSYIADLTAYRTYMINHEDGHALGHMHAHECLADGLAPAMMQQTIGLKTPSGKLCEANPWPYPQGAKDAPGAEAVDTRQNNEYYLQGGE